MIVIMLRWFVTLIFWSRWLSFGTLGDYTSPHENMSEVWSRI